MEQQTPTLPYNEEAEQGLLGTILFNNKAADKVRDFLRPEHFHDPLHQDVYRRALALIDAGRPATPVTLRGAYENWPGLEDHGGGAGYLALLAGAVVSPANVEHYGRIIHDLFLRRELVNLGDGLATAARDQSGEWSGESLVTDAQATLHSLAQTGAQSRPMVSWGEAAARALKMAQDAAKAPGGIVGMPTGLYELDALLGGLRRKSLVVVGGRPSMGKSALACGTLKYNLAAAGYGVCEFSLEMGSEDHGFRAVAGITGIDLTRIMRGQLEPREWERVIEAQGRLATLPVMIDDIGGVDVGHIRRRAMEFARKRRLDVIIVDHINLMRGSAGAAKQGQTAEVTEITAGLKTLAKELDCCVIALCQLNRSLESRDDKRPQMSDLRQSGSVEQDADVVTFVYRHEYYLERAQPARRTGEDQDKFNQRFSEWEQAMAEAHGVGECIVAKNRMGAVGTVRLAWNASTVWFDNLARGTW